jgi:serine/threonine protein kinase
MKTVLMLADQMLSRVEYMHRKGFIHGDIKPSNYLMGLNSNSNQVFLTDFGLAAPISKAPATFTGTVMYASVNVQSGLPASRRDDLESLAYVLIHLANGSLPWSHVPKSAFRQVLHVKRNSSVADICGSLPSQFHQFLECVRSLQFNENPDYAGYRRLFRGLFEQRGFVYDSKFDWMKPVRGQLSFQFEKAMILQPPTTFKRATSLMGVGLPGRSLAAIAKRARPRRPSARTGG